MGGMSAMVGWLVVAAGQSQPGTEPMVRQAEYPALAESIKRVSQVWCARVVRPGYTAAASPTPGKVDSTRGTLSSRPSRKLLLHRGRRYDVALLNGLP